MKIIDIGGEKLVPFGKNAYYSQFKGLSDGFASNDVDVNGWCYECC